MRFSIATLIAATSIGFANAFSATANDNVVLYWGQNSAGSQQSLGSYCQSTDADMYVISFLTDFPQTGMNIVGCDSTFSGSSLLHCSSVAEDIKTCQSLGKKVLLSLGGAVGSYGFSNDQEAESYAQTLWDMFGGGSSDTRPFDDAVVDGFDLDIENGNSVGYAALTSKLRELYSGGDYYISGAPQCVYPDASLGDALENGYFDFVFVQFYNNPCGIDKGSNFNWNTWKDYASSTSKNSNVKIYLGIPASTTSASSGYSSPSTVSDIVAGIKGDSCFGGIMMWDASQAFSNIIDGTTTYCGAMKSVLGGSSSSSSGSSDSNDSASESSVAVSSQAATTQQENVAASTQPASSTVSTAYYAQSSSVQAISNVVVISAPGSSDSASTAPAASSSTPVVITSSAAPASTNPVSDSVFVSTVYVSALGMQKIADVAADVESSSVNADSAADVEVSSVISASSAPSAAFVTVTYSAPTSSADTTTTIKNYESVMVVLSTMTLTSTLYSNSSSSLSQEITTAVTLTKYVTVTHADLTSSTVSTPSSTVSIAATISAIPTDAGTAGSGTGSVINAKDVTGECAGKTGTSLSTCLNAQFANNKIVELDSGAAASDSASASTSPAATGSSSSSSTFDTESCVDGAVTCYQGKFALCNFSKWVFFACPATTMCSALNLDNENVVVGCNFESVVLAEQSAAEASATAALKMFKRYDEENKLAAAVHGNGLVNIGARARMGHVHHVHRQAKKI